MTIERVFEASRLNHIANDPGVYPWVAGALQGPIDLSLVAADPSNVALLWSHGACVFRRHQVGLYEVHTMVLPAGRGARTIDCVRECLHWMFCHTDAVEIWTRAPRGNLGARALAKSIGGTLEFTAERGWIKDEIVVPAAIFALKIQDWMRDAPELPAFGAEFHMKLEDEYRRLGKSEPVHPDDAIHDRYVGAAVEMIRGGQPFKAQIFFNRWAHMAAYQEMRIVGTDPVMVDIHDAVLEVHGGSFFVAECRLAG